MLQTIASIVAQIPQDQIEIPQNQFSGDSIAKGLQIVFGLAGAVAFLLVTFAGLKYVLSQGNPQETAKAKGAIIDAMIGLVIAMSAFAIVSFVLGRLG